MLPDLPKSAFIGTDMTMVEISEMFNFKSPAHFTNAYKKHFGVNPSEERNQVTELTTFFTYTLSELLSRQAA